MLAVICAVGLYAVAGGLVAPAFVKKTIVEKVREKLGRVAAIDDFTFNPFTLAATAKGFRIMEADAKTVFASFDQLDVDGSISSAYRLAPVVDQLTLSGLKVNVVRETETRYNLSDILAKIAAMPPTAESDKARFSVANIRLAGARIDFDDKPKGAKHQVSEIDIAIPFISNLPSHLKEYVQPSFAAKVNGAALRFQGESLPFENSLRTHLAIDLDALDVRRYVEYSPTPLPVKIDSGKLDAKLSIRFTQAAGKDPSLDVAGTLALRDIAVTAPDEGGTAKVARIDADIASLDPIAGLVKVNSVKVTDAGLARGPVRLAAVEAKDIRVDLKGKRVDVASLASNDAAIEMMRKRDGSIELPMRLKDEGAKAEAPSPWVVALGKLTLDGYRITLHDASVKPVAEHHVNVAHLEAGGLSTEKGTKSSMAAKVTLDKAGSADLDATFTLSPLDVNAKVDARHVDIVPARRYVEQFKTVALKSGFASAKGTVTLRGEGNAMRVGYNGTAAVSNLATVDTTINEDLLNWDAVRLSGIALKWAGESAPLDLAIAEIAVDKAYSRIVVNPDGKLNLQQLKQATAEQPAKPAPTPVDVKPRNVRIERVVFTDSRLNFSDHFIKPNYTADVGALAGTVTGLSSEPQARGVVELKGAYDETSPVTIAGTVNPLSGDLFLDIAAKGKDIELPKLSAYSARYAGYGITKGRLTLDVKYHIENGKMEGRNKIFIDQLTFGERVEGPEATKLPVLFAVNLLKDSKGAINLELPISGSLDDPQFEIGALVGQVVANLLKKAITSPFSLLTAAFGGGGGGDKAGDGGEDLAFVDFEPGRDELDAAHRKKLDAVVKALLDRPAIKLEITPRNDAQKDLAALKKAALRARLKAADDAQYAAQVKAEYLREAAPKAAPGKPPAKDAASKEPSAAEMEAFLLERVPVGEEELRALDARRSERVKTYLVGTGQLPADRVLIAVATSPAADKPQASRVDFALK